MMMMMMICSRAATGAEAWGQGSGDSGRREEGRCPR